MTTKEKIIASLEEAKGTYISGAELAKRCNVSRNAIWKNITELKKQGYKIESVNNRGYMLETDTDIISKAGILIYLEKDKKDRLTSYLAERIFVYDEIDSTNVETKRHLILDQKTIDHGSIIVAKRQTMGKGHRGRDFSSPEGGIYFSLLLDPLKIRNKNIPVTTMISDAVKVVLQELYEVGIKKEKDSSLYVNKKKVCGILTEGVSDLETGIYSSYIVGVGIHADVLSTLGKAHPQKNKIIANIIEKILSNVNL